MTSTTHSSKSDNDNSTPIRLECKEAWVLYSELYPQVLDATHGRIVFVRGWKMTTKQSLIEECAAALQFPPLKAENWDAFEEDIRNLEWIPSRQKLLVILESEKVLESGSNEERMIFFRILVGAARQHGASQLKLILQCEQQHVRLVEQLLRAASH